MNEYEEILTLQMAINLANQKLNNIVRTNFKRDNDSPVDTSAIETYIEALKTKLDESIFDAADVIAGTTKPQNL